MEWSQILPWLKVGGIPPLIIIGGLVVWAIMDRRAALKKLHSSLTTLAEMTGRISVLESTTAALALETTYLKDKDKLQNGKLESIINTLGLLQVSIAKLETSMEHLLKYHKEHA